MMFNDYGKGRTDFDEPVLPIMAWKLNTEPKIKRDEMLVSVEKIHLERNSLRQIIYSVGNDEQKIKQQIMSIISERGKLHNPFTGTGGTLYGRIKEIGKDFNQKAEIGDKVLITTSATMIPLFLKEIKSIDLIYGSMEVEGHCILFNKYNYLTDFDEKNIETMLLGFEESPALYYAYDISRKMENILISGNNLMVSLTYAFVIKKATQGKCNLTGFLYPDLDVPVSHESLMPYYEKVFDTIHIVEPEEILDMDNEIVAGHMDNFDLCINCSDTSESEILDVLSLKNHGTLLFTNVVFTYQPALFFSEGTKKDIKIIVPVGYVEGYDKVTSSLMAEFHDDIAGFANELRTVEKKSIETYRKSKQQAILKEMSDVSNMYGFIYVSDKMKDIVSAAYNVAKYDCSVLITGETGTGKEKVAKLIHSLSKRRKGPYISINCGAIPTNLMEMEFFGYEKGAFTGANPSGKQGYFDIASNGFLLLDEIAELDPLIQSKLLRVLQEKEFFRVGGSKPVHTGARIIASTNMDLKALSESGEFRRDLFYRLNVVSIHVPPLRERKEDIIPIAKYFIEQYNEKFDMNKFLSAEAMEMLETYEWKGNVRELENTIQRLMINSIGDEITKFDVSDDFSINSSLNYNVDSGDADDNVELDFSDAYGLSMDDTFISKVISSQKEQGQQSFEDYMAQIEKEFLKYNLKKYGSTRKTAEVLKVSQSTIMRKKNKYNL